MSARYVIVMDSGYYGSPQEDTTVSGPYTRETAETIVAWLDYEAETYQFNDHNALFIVELRDPLTADDFLPIDALPEREGDDG